MSDIKKIFNNRRKLIVFIVVLAVGYLLWRMFFPGKKEEVKTAKIEKGTVREELVLSGEIKALEQANLSFLSSGEINYIGIKEGQEVKKGDTLVKLDSTSTYQTFLQADADLRRYDASLAKTYDEVKGHEKDESYTQIETRTLAETNRDKAYRNYIIAQKNLSNLTLKAPFDGVVARITHPFSGINTSLTESQIEIINPKTIYFSVSADQTEVTKVKIGQKVDVVLDSFPDKQNWGEVVYIGYVPEVGEVGAVYEVKVTFSSDLSTQELKIGMTGDAKFVISEKEDTLNVPLQFIHSDSNGKYINLGKKNNKKYIQLGVEGEDTVEIKGDVSQGDIVYD